MGKRHRPDAPVRCPTAYNCHGALFCYGVANDPPGRAQNRIGPSGTDPLSRSSLSVDARSVSGATRWRRLLAALADSILEKFGSGRTMELGRSRRSIMRPPRRRRAGGSSPTRGSERSALMEFLTQTKRYVRPRRERQPRRNVASRIGLFTDIMAQTPQSSFGDGNHFMRRD